MDSSKFVSFLSRFEEASYIVVCNWQVPFAEESLSIVGLVCCCCHLRFHKQLSDSWGDGGQGLNCIFAFLSSTMDKFDFQKSKEGIERSNRTKFWWMCSNHKICVKNQGTFYTFFNISVESLHWVAWLFWGQLKLWIGDSKRPPKNN